MPMPVFKTWKAIGRRKSNPPVQEDPSPPNSSNSSSFHVIHRGDSNRISFASSSEKPLPPVVDHRAWLEEDSNSSNRGSGGSETTANSRIYTQTMSYQATSHQANSHQRKPSFLDLPQDFDNDFGRLFGSADKKNKQTMDESTLAQPASLSFDLPKTPANMALRRHIEIEPSPNSVDSKTSKDGLLASSQSDYSQYRDSPTSKPINNVRRIDHLPNNSPLSHVLRRTDSNESFARSGPGEDADAKLVRKSFIERNNRDENSRSVSPAKDSLIPSTNSYPVSSHSSAPSLSSDDMPLVDRLKFNINPSEESTTKHTTITSKQSLFSPPLKSNTLSPTDNYSRLSQLSSSRGSSTGSVDIIEQEKKLLPSPAKRKDFSETARPRLVPSVTEQSLGTNFRTSPRQVSQSQSTPNLPTLQNLPTVSENKKYDSDDDDDDDVPLGVLQANNFPKKLGQSDPKFSQASSYLSPTSTQNRPQSVVSGVTQSRGPLPPFARKLPSDPYGSNPDLLAKSSRQSFMPPPGQSPVPGMPPGGLVGMIAEEEKMKSYRRGGAGSDNRMSTLPNMNQMNVPSGINPGMSMGMQGFQMPGLLPQQGMSTSQEQMMMQIIQQQNMMIQAMYNMQQNQSIGMQSQFDAQSAFLQPTMPTSRPMSAMENLGPGSPRTRSMVNLKPPINTQRTMSMVNTSSPFAGQSWNGQLPLINSAGSIFGDVEGYAPSIAPSERSNVDQAPRYRPVSSIRMDLEQRSFGNEPDTNSRKKKSGFFSAIMHSKGKHNEAATSTTQDEEEDWSNFAKKRRSAMPI